MGSGDGNGQVELFARGNDDLGTPAWIIEHVRAMVGSIELDPCANPWSNEIVQPEYGISKHDGMDGLFRWSEIATRNVWLNPPYSNPKPWAQRAVEAADDGLEVFALMKLDPSTEWSRILRERPRAVCDFHKRIRFEGGKYAAGAMASTLIYFGPRPFLFCHEFQDVGEVRVCR